MRVCDDFTALAICMSCFRDWRPSSPDEVCYCGSNQVYISYPLTLAGSPTEKIGRRIEQAERDA